jgi:hypothetical protein
MKIDVGEQRGDHPALGDTRVSGHDVPVNLDSCSTPAADEPEHFRVVDHLGHLPQQAGMVEVVEEPGDVELGHPSITVTDRFTYPTHGLVVPYASARYRRCSGCQSRCQSTGSNPTDESGVSGLKALLRGLRRIRNY